MVGISLAANRPAARRWASSFAARPGYRDAQPETVRRYLRMLGETLSEGCARCSEAKGLTADEIRDMLLHSPVYRGVPAANGTFAVAQRVLPE